jgi:hypothetical protein
MFHFKIYRKQLQSALPLLRIAIFLVSYNPPRPQLGAFSGGGGEGMEGILNLMSDPKPYKTKN